MDKLVAKRLAADKLGREWAIPTLWSGQSTLEMPRVEAEVMVKARHGCNQFARFNANATPDDWHRVRARAERWVAQRYGTLLQEWAYEDVPRGVLIEPFVSDDGELPVDYKFYVFGGRATHVQVHLGRSNKHRWILHDRDWRQLVPVADAPPPPSSLAAMLQAAEHLAADEEFLRVDFYEVGRRPLFGEFCLYPGSGLDPFAAPWIDAELGALWRQARCSAPYSASKPATIATGHHSVALQHFATPPPQLSSDLTQAAVAKASMSSAIIASLPASNLRRSAPTSGRKRSA